MKRLTAICVAAACSLGMMLNGEANAVSNDAELCNWGKWASNKNITIEKLVETLNGIDGMPDEDKLFIIECWALNEGTK